METPLCKCTDTNVGEVLLMCMHITRKHSLSWVVLLDIFGMLNTIFNNDMLPKTKYMINKYMDVPMECLAYHVICSSCSRYLGKTVNFKNDITCTCGTKVDPKSTGSFFIEINVMDQLKKMLSDPKIVNNLHYRLFRTKKDITALEDIYDGDVYQRLIHRNDQLGNEWNLSYTFNTDGCQSSYNSKITVWPIYLMIHELPDHIRKKSMVLAGLWVAKTEPIMNVFLQPFVDQANKLSSEGLKWMYNGVEKSSKLFALGCCVDSVARCGILNMKRFNGTDGCTYCEHPTELIEGVRKYPMQVEVPIARTDESIKQQMHQAYQNNEAQVGVWGPSALMNLNYFDLVDGMVLDFMHSCLLGVTELYTNIIFSNASHKEYYVGSPAKMHIINKRLLSIKPPTCIGKIPRSINERNMWKASEWLNWLIFYSLICLRGVLPQKYYNNLALFVSAMCILLQDSITNTMLETARVLLIKFVFSFQSLYGKKYMHYNVHLLLHLTSTVKNWGPLWADSTFPFENQNKLLLQMKKNYHQIAKEIVNKLLIYQQIPLLENENCISVKIKKFCNDLSTKSLKIFVRIKDCMLLGRGKINNFSPEEIDCLKNIVDMTKITETLKYSKMIYNNNRYTVYNLKSKKTNDSVIELIDNRFGIVTKICSIKYSDVTDVIIFYKPIIVENTSIVNTTDVIVEHFKKCTMQSESLKCDKYDMLYKPCLFMQSQNEYFISTIPKGVMGRSLN